VNWSGRKVLITGACGFIGSHLVEALVDAGAQARAFAHYNSLGSAGWLDSSQSREQIDVVFGDLRDSDSVSSAVKGSEIVFHLGSLVAIPYSYETPTAYIRTNIEGTLNVAQACRSAGVGKLIHTSTSEVYGMAADVPMGEDHQLVAQSPYAASKIGADKIVESLHRSFELPTITVRPFNTYGPRQSQRAIIPTIISQALVGDEVRLGNLHPTRDLTFVEDTVAGFLACAESELSGGQTLNLGTGVETSIGQLVEEVAAIIGRGISVVVDDQRVRAEGSEVDRLCADATRVNELTGWTPRVDLRQGLKRTVEWMEQNLSTYRPDEYVR